MRKEGRSRMDKKILIITGGCSGLGLAIVKQAIERGLYVCNLARNKAKMAALAQELSENYRGFVGDISDEVFVRRSIQEIHRMGEIAYLINCAEKTCFKAPIDYTGEDIDVSLSGLKGMILCSGETLKCKNEQNLKIVNIMSSAALKGNPQEAVYCATKWGERGYTESLKAAYKGTSVKVIGVYPGGMNTEFWNEKSDYVSQEKANTFMSPKEVATVILDNMMNYSGLNVADIVIERNDGK